MTDRTLEYVEKCRKATEIQELWHEGNCYTDIHAREGDCVWLIPYSELRYFSLKRYNFGRSKWVYETSYQQVGLCSYVTNTNGSVYGSNMVGFDEYKAVEIYIPNVRYFTGVENVIWLPRQDQLQEMLVFKSVTQADDIYIKIERFYQFVNEVLGDFESMEQLWLAFVMKEKYGKKWGGEDWVV